MKIMSFESNSQVRFVRCNQVGTYHTVEFTWDRKTTKGDAYFSDFFY